MGILLGSRGYSQQTDSVDARAAQSVLEVKEGNVLATTVLVRNPSAVKRTYSARLALPEGWRTILRDTRFELGAGQGDTRLLSFSLPMAAAAGTYQVRYFIADAAAPARETEVRFEVRVLPILQLEMKLLEAPRFAVAGRQYAARFGVTNRGNVGGQVRLKVRTTEGFSVRLDSARVYLGPKQTRTITAFVATSRDLRAKTANSVEVTAQFASDSTVQARAASVIDVVPQVTEEDERYLELPLTVTGRTAGEDGRIGGQVEVTGSGSFTEDRTDRFDLMVRTPDIQSQSSIGLRDEYRLRYAANMGELEAGDWNYSLSPLTELSRFAFGGKGTIRYGGARAGGFINKTRFLDPRQRELAGFLGYEIAGRYDLGVNFLRKNEQLTSDITSLRSILRPLSLANLDVEYGVSSGGKGRDDAYAVQLNGREDVLSYEARVVRAGEAYTGYYRDVDYKSFALSVFPLRDLRIEGYYRAEDRNLDLDTSLYYAPKEQFLQVGGGYSNLVALYFRSTVQEDRLPVPRYRRKEEMAQIRLGYSTGNVGLFSNIDLGTTQDRLTQKSFPFQRYALHSTFSVGATQNYSASLEYSTERDLFSGDPQDRVGGSINASVFLAAKTSLLATIYWTRALVSPQQDFALFDVALRHVFPFKHEVTVRARQNYAVPSYNGRELAYMLQYSVPLGIPVRRLTSNGQLRGRILDEQGRGVRNVLINVGGSAALTDADGEFFFPALSPGEHYLVLDKFTIGMSRIPNVVTPLAVNIEGGKETKLDVPLVQSSSISGLVTLFEFEKDDTSMTALVEAGPQQGLVLELSNGTEIQRRVSDSKGRFFFSDLRPGRWTVSVIGGALPQYHSLDQQSLTVDLAAGTKRSAPFKVLPRKRAIRIIETGVVAPAMAPSDTVARHPVEIQQPPIAVVKPPVETVPAPRQRSATDTSAKRSTETKAARPGIVQPAGTTAQGMCLVSYDKSLGGYVIQISSWVTLTKATARAHNAKRVTGLNVKIEKAEIRGLGTRYRVKVGTFKTSAEADSYCPKLLGMEAEPLIPRERPMCLISFDSRYPGYMVQISSWETWTKATARARNAERVTGLKSRIDKAEISGLGKRYRVKVGPFRTRDEAESSCQHLLEMEKE